MLRSIVSSFESMSWLKRIVLASTVLVLIGFVIALIVTPSGSESVNTVETVEKASFIVVAFLAFFAGVFSFVSPCTLPILPAYFAFTFQSDRKRIMTMTAAFFVGFAVVNALLGATASALGGWLVRNQVTLTKMAGWLLLGFGLMSVLGKGFTGPTFTRNPSASLGGAAVFGATFAITVTACTAPILGGILTLSAGQSVARGVVLLFIYSLGLGLPLILVSTFIGDRPRDSLIWRILRGKGWDVSIGLGPLREEPLQLHLHTTNIASGVLFLLLGYVMVRGISLQTLIPPGLVNWLTEVQFWFDDLQNKLVALLG